MFDSASHSRHLLRRTAIVILILFTALFSARIAQADVTTIRIYVGAIGGAHEQPAYDKIEQLFNATHTNIQIKFEYRWSGDWINQGQPNLERYLRSTAAPADLVTRIGLYSAIATDEAVPGTFEDLTPYLKSDAVLETSLGAFRDTFQRNGKLVGLPIGIYPAMLFVNPSAFKAAGLPLPPTQVGAPYIDDAGNKLTWDWETVANLAKRLTRDKNGNQPGDEKFNPGQVQMYGYADFYLTMRTILAKQGIPNMGLSTDNKKAAFNTETVQESALSQKVDGFGKEPICVQKFEKLGDDPKQAIDQLYLGENVALFRSFHLPFSDHVHCLVACQCASCRLEGKETQAGSGAAFDEAVVLLDEVVEVFDLAQLAIRR